jgi:hypothetical protein
MIYEKRYWKSFEQNILILELNGLDFGNDRVSSLDVPLICTTDDS